MKTIIAGSRDIEDPVALARVIRASEFTITEVVCGAARGVDLLGEEWAKAREIPIRIFPAKWAVYGKRAGPIRNMQMGDYADALIYLWDGESPGTRMMIQYAKKIGLKVFGEILSRG